MYTGSGRLRVVCSYINKIIRNIITTTGLLVLLGLSYQLIVGALSSFDLVSKWPASIQGSLWLLRNDRLAIYNQSRGIRYFALSEKIAPYRWLGYSDTLKGSVFIGDFNNQLYTLSVNYDSGAVKINPAKDTRCYQGEWALYNEHLFHIRVEGNQVNLISRDLVNSTIEKVIQLPNLPATISYQADQWPGPPVFYDKFIAFSVGQQICIFNQNDKGFCRVVSGTLPVFAHNGLLVYKPLDSGYWRLKICKMNMHTRKIKTVLLWQASGINRLPVIFAMIPQNRPDDIVRIFAVPQTDMVICEVQKYNCGNNYIVIVDKNIHLLPVTVNRWMWMWCPV